MTYSSFKYECYAGPADGLTVILDADMHYLDYIYLQLPLRKRDSVVKEIAVFKEPPKGQYTCYKLGKPTITKCQWAGDSLTTKEE